MFKICAKHFFAMLVIVAETYSHIKFVHFIGLSTHSYLHDAFIFLNKHVSKMEYFLCNINIW